MDKKTQFNAWYAILAVLAVLWIREAWVAYRSVQVIPYSRFVQLVDEGKVERITIGSERIRGAFKSPQDGHAEFVTLRVDPALAGKLESAGVEFSGAVESTFLKDLLSWVLPTLVFFGIWWFLVRRMAERQGLGGFMTVGRSKAKVYMESKTGVTFDDVAGVDEAKAELVEIIDFLKDPAQYGKLGARIPKGILLVGPPGTGKTMLAKAVAGEAGVPFFSISGSEFVEMFVGVGAARVRDLFEQASRLAPAIIFIDELDALGRARGAASGIGGHDEREQTLNQLLAELDGFDPRTGVVLLAATNRPEILDPALLRAGRFDRQVLVDRPDKIGRRQILDVHVRRVTLSPDVDTEQIAALTPGFSGADLANLVNEAALLATRRRAESVSMQDFTGAIERLVAGLEKRNRLLIPREREVIAFHEMGHALIALSIEGVDPVHKVSIIPRGVGALGYTIQRPTEDRFLMTQRELENKIAVLMGGRAAEHLVFGELSTGAADDLAKATDIARSMVARYGMNPELGNVTYESDRATFLGPMAGTAERDYSEQTAREIDVAIQDIVARMFERAHGILADNRDLLERTARALLEKETLDESALAELCGDIRREPASAGAPSAQGQRPSVGASTGEARARGLHHGASPSGP